MILGRVIAHQRGTRRTRDVRTDRNTRMTVGTITVLDTGTLEIGTVDAPIAADVKAELVISDEPVDTTRDPEQFTVGLVGCAPNPGQPK